MSYHKFDVIVTEFTFIDNKAKSKIRPSVIVSSNEYNSNTDFVVIAMITSAKHSKLWGDLAIENPEIIGLKEPSIIRMKFANILYNDILAKIGTLDLQNHALLQKQLNILFDIAKATYF